MYLRSRLASRWIESLQKQLDQNQGIPAVIKRRLALSDWEKLRSPPSGRAEDELSFALDIAPGKYDHPLVDTCLKRCLQVIDAGAGDERWSTWWSLVRAVEHGRFTSTGQFARAWTDDSDLDASLLASAAAEVLHGVLTDRPVWTELAQCEYVDGVQLLILAGELKRAAEKLQIRKKFNRVEHYHTWNVRLLELLERSANNENALKDHFDPYFDKIRDPRFHVQSTEVDGNILFGIPLLRLRLALIRWIYIERKPIAGNWRHIIGQIGY